MNLKRPSPAMVVALIALVLSMTGGAIAAVNYARNAGKVDGYDAVQAKSSNEKAAGRLVATYPGGEQKGRLPFRFLSGVAAEADVDALADTAARGKNGAQTIAVSDNAATTEVNLLDLGGGNFQVACVDQADAVGSRIQGRASRSRTTRPQRSTSRVASAPVTRSSARSIQTRPRPSWSVSGTRSRSSCRWHQRRPS